MKTRTAVLSEGMLEAVLLVAVTSVPLFVNYYGARPFELPKAALAGALAIAAAVFLTVVMVETATSEGGAADMWRRVRGQPIAWAALALLVATAVATAASPSRLVSFAGTPERMQGLAGLIAASVLLAASAVVAQSPRRRERLTAAIVSGAVPVAVIAIAQVLGLQAVAGVVEDRRAFGTLSNPIFLGAYCMLVLPLASAKAVRALRTGRAVSGLLWTVAGALLLVALISSASRGPMLGLAAGAVVFLLAAGAALRARALAGFGLALLLLGAVGIGLINTPQVAGQLGGLPIVGRFAQISNTTSGSQAVRLGIWSATADLVRNAPPNRLIVGHGPEQLLPALLPHGRPNLGGPGQADRLVDRAHSVAFDQLVMTGILGLLARIGLWAAWLLTALAAAGLLSGPARRRGAVGALLGGTAAGAGVWLVRPELTGATVPLGMLVGLLAFLTWAALASRAGQQGSEAGLDDGGGSNRPGAAPDGHGAVDQRPAGSGGIALALLACGAALVAESAFGIETVVPRMLAWILMGMTLAVGIGSSDGTAAQAGAPRPTAAGRRTARSVGRDRATDQASARPGRSEAVRSGVAMGLVFGTAIGLLFFMFLVTPAGADRPPTTLPLLALAALVVWAFGLLAAVDSGADGLAYIIVSLATAALLVLARNLGLLLAPDASAIVAAAVLVPVFVALGAGAMLGQRAAAAAGWFAGPAAVLYPLVAVGAVAAIVAGVLPRLRADVYFRRAIAGFETALAVDDQTRFQAAESDFTKATALYPNDDQAYSRWAELYTQLGALMPTPEQSQAAFSQAQALLNTAEGINPRQPYHTFNRGRVQLLFADQLASQGLTDEAARVAADSEVALQTVFDRVPYDPAVARELALAKLLRGKTEEAIALLEYARDDLGAEDADTYQGLARAYRAVGRDTDAESALARALSMTEPEDADPAALLQMGDLARDRGDMQSALRNYEQAVEKLGPAVDWAVLYNLGLMYRDLGSSAEAAAALQGSLARAPDEQTAERIQAALMSVLSEDSGAGPGGLPFDAPAP